MEGEKRHQLISGICVGGDYTADEEEFLTAVMAWRKAHRVRFPTLTDLLGVVRSLGYRKGAPGGGPSL